LTEKLADLFVRKLVTVWREGYGLRDFRAEPRDDRKRLCPSRIATACCQC
jgi:hypothetical protein